MAPEPFRKREKEHETYPKRTEEISGKYVRKVVRRKHDTAYTNSKYERGARNDEYGALGWYAQFAHPDDCREPEQRHGARGMPARK